MRSEGTLVTQMKTLQHSALTKGMQKHRAAPRPESAEREADFSGISVVFSFVFLFLSPRASDCQIFFFKRPVNQGQSPSPAESPARGHHCHWGVLSHSTTRVIGLEAKLLEDAPKGSLQTS